MVYDILTGYFYQSLMKSLLQHICKRLYKRLNALKTQEVSFIRLTLLAQYFLPPVKQGTPRAAPSSSQAGRAQRMKESGNTVQSADRRSSRVRAQRSLRPALPRPGARSAKKLTCIYIWYIPICTPRCPPLLFCCWKLRTIQYLL